MKQKKIIFLFTKFLYVFIFLICQNNFGQTQYADKDIDSAFINYSKLYQEVVHTQLNKTIYLKGESIGFTSYVLNKKNNTPSTITKNLYCTISDKDNNIIKEKLVLVENGITSNTFDLDSLFTSGNYIFKAHTNWMLNFKQQNYFVQQFKVIDLKKEDFIKKVKPTTKLDVQFLPEGGHVIANVITTMGVIAKDNFGKGVPDITGKIFDEEDTFMTSFKLNQLGLGRFSFLPKMQKKYRAEIYYNNNKLIIPLKHKITAKGVGIKIINVRNDLLISLVTNKATLEDISGKEFVVANYNSDRLEKISFTFSQKEIVTKKISLDKMLTGVNVFTLFNKDNMPISERLFFNYNGLSILKSSQQKILKNENDSLKVNIKYNRFNIAAFNNVSVSVLPSNTKSYNKNKNIISQTLIQPYIKGNIENGAYYFTNINQEKKYALDNLFITQGWSSYDWSEIFNDNFKLNYGFEKGINIQIDLQNTKRDKQILVHHSSKRQAEIIQIKKGIPSFESSSYFPIDDESLFISTINKKGKLYPASLYIRHRPNKFSNLDDNSNSLSIKPFFFASEKLLTEELISESVKKTQKLDEVVLKVNLKKERVEKIKNNAFGKVYFFNEENPFVNFDIFSFLTTKGFLAERIPFTNEVLLINRIAATLNGSSVPAVFIDDFLLNDLSQLTWLDVNIIDYININRTGIGEGLRGGAGTIRIYTDPYKAYSRKRKTTRKFKFPLTFSKSKQFYTPVYQSYNSTFYKRYGTIDWLPKNTIDKNGNLILNFKNNQPNSIRLFIEGITSNGDFIFEEKVLNF